MQLVQVQVAAISDLGFCCLQLTRPTWKCQLAALLSQSSGKMELKRTF
jgi:hypothetical protein